MEDTGMLQSIFAIAVLLPVRRRMRNTDVGRPEPAGPGRSPREHGAAKRLADRALCGIDLPLVL
jgi:hypothetical protein